MRLEHHLVGGYVRYISPHIIIIMYGCILTFNKCSVYTIIQRIRFELFGKRPHVFPNVDTWWIRGGYVRYISPHIIISISSKKNASTAIVRTYYVSTYQQE